MKMPFGKYHDWPLAAVPLSYLAYALENWELDDGIAASNGNRGVLRRVRCCAPTATAWGSARCGSDRGNSRFPTATAEAIEE
jgi:hypothetical protein